MKKFLFVLLTILLITVVAHAADDSDFIGTWVLKTMFFGEYGIEVDAANFGISGSLTVTEDKITSDYNGEISGAEWTRKSEDTISIVTESGDMDFVLEGNALVVIGENENGDTTKMTFYKPGNTCNCEELMKQIEDLTAQLEELKAGSK